MVDMNPLGKASSNGVGFNKQTNDNKEIDLNEISFLYSTKKKETQRSTFDKTFDETALADSAQGAKFLQGLIDNKDVLMEKLGLSDEKYDSLSCVALALASQETGMGMETGYQEENTGIRGFFRKVAKWFDAKVLHHGSASSGLTQMKIHDFLNSDNLTDEQKTVMKDLGVVSKGVATDNLYSQPDKSAVATVVVLSSLADKYDNYSEVIDNHHQEIAKNLNDNLTDTERLEKGSKILENFSSIYQEASDEEKSNIRTGLKGWILAKNDSKIGDKTDNDYNEEYQLNELNNLLSQHSDDFSLKQEDLDYIRYFLTSDNQKMSVVEYCAYAWNKGTGETGMQLDRMLADKVGIILSDPEDFDYDQFSANVSNLAQKYAQQSTDRNVLAYLNDNIEEQKAC